MRAAYTTAVFLTLQLFLTTRGEPSTNLTQQLKELSLSEEDLKRVVDVHHNWYLFSLKAIMVQMAKELLRISDSGSRQRLRLCLKRIVHAKDVEDTASCLLKAKEQLKLRDKSEEMEAFVQAPVKIRSSKRTGATSIKKKRIHNNTRTKKTKWKNRKRRHRRIRRSIQRLALSKEINSGTKHQHHQQVTMQKSLPPLIAAPSRTPIHGLSNLVVSMFGDVPMNDMRKKWSTTYRKMLELSEILEKNEKMPGTRVYSTPVYDLVMDNGKRARKPTEADIPPHIRKVFDLVNSFVGSENARILSPRIGAVVPEKHHKKGFLSPSMFPFYTDDKEEQILPIPKILEQAGVKEKDREDVIGMIMEITGARKTVDKALTVLQNFTSFGLGDKLLSVTEKIGNSFDELQRSLSRAQKNDMIRRGFTFMEPSQMKRLHSERELNNAEIKAMSEEYETLPKHHREEALWEAIAKIAGKTRRQKRQVSVLRPLILSPFVFTPVVGLSVLGPVILSPNIFSPLLLAPNVLTPVLLSPSFGKPIILSPYVLSPYILSPTVVGGNLLSPYLLSPNILNPALLTGAILSPFALSPNILSPAAAGAVVLSPNLLSPSILSPACLMVELLSPSFLS